MEKGVEELQHRVNAGLEDESISFKNATRMIVELGDVSNHCILHREETLPHIAHHTHNTLLPSLLSYSFPLPLPLSLDIVCLCHLSVEEGSHEK